MADQSFRTVLKEGTVIGTKLGCSNTWYQNIIYKAGDNTVQIALLNQYLENLLLKDSNILLKLTLEYFEYLFEGTVCNIHAGYPGYLEVCINKMEELVNTREFPRYDVCLGAYICSMADGKKEFCIINNLSMSGMAFVSGNRMEYGEEFQVNMYLPDQNIARVQGKVIRRSVKNNLNDYSVQFTKVDDDNRTLLSNYILSLEDEKTRLRELL